MALKYLFIEKYRELDIINEIKESLINLCETLYQTANYGDLEKLLKTVQKIGIHFPNFELLLMV